MDLDLFINSVNENIPLGTIQIPQLNINGKKEQINQIKSICKHLN